MNKTEIKPVSLTTHPETNTLWKWKEQATGYLFLAPSILLFVIFLFYPLVKSLYLSFFLTDPQGNIARFVGIENYVKLFASSGFLNSIGVTGLFTLYTVPTSIILALIMAVLTHQKIKGIRLFQFTFSLPLAISVGTASVIWMLLFHPSSGMFNYFLNLIGVGPIFWLSDPNWALFSISLMTVWMNIGFLYIVLLSGLQGIPDHLYESAKLDGAGVWNQFRHVTVPMLSPTIFFAVIVSIIGAFQAFGQIHIMTQGGPVDRTNVMVYDLYREAFIHFQFGTGSARALVLFVIILLLTLVQFKLAEKKVHYQ
ncbi:carbohydrate ABC transporter permease [Desmospora profundinema]|uniref:Sn-glycerol 3-phosphate transport system permease protein n=1 Tax=Desmospora profundinema TaxID=1571184 RepID=A0ABU1IKD0_9BACL|nr:sugar ABC transporter permease [Desmospora profundinema]MDR6224604.1 sn-glycerol 3-phosphate transport system permease protein [Desmospora profundinema]